MSILKPKYNYIPFSRETVDGKRLYNCPDGSRVASVTTILDKTKPQEKIEALQRWRKSVGEAKAQQITTEAASRGTRMHSYMEGYVKDGFLKDAGTNPFSQQSHKMAKVIVDNGMPHIDEAWGVEVPLYHAGLYAGTTDFVGVWKGNPCIADFKQTNKTKKREWIEDYFLQLAAYAEAHNSMHGTNIRTGVILMCSQDFQYQEFVVEGAEFEHWVGKWWDRVETYYTKNG